ncbi:MAG: hypothetical protein IJ996_00665 [Clostridia bacterium]|nr:hypothetical protein [Clostridia bacterium]
MATNLEGNEKLQRFIELLSVLNHQAVDMLKTGDTQILFAMNGTVEEMYSIQQKGTEDAYTVIDEDMKIIRENYIASITMVQSNENGKFDMATGFAVKKFVHNIFDATVRIVMQYGLA